MTQQMTVADAQSLARRATLRRLVAALINEKLVSCTVLDAVSGSVIVAPPSCADGSSPAFSFAFSVVPEAVLAGSRTIEFIDQEDIASWSVSVKTPAARAGDMSMPSALFLLVAPHLSPPPSDDVAASIAAELDSSVRNQELAYLSPREPLSISSPAIDWERAVVEGHPTHPMHRTRIGLTKEETLEWAAEMRRTVGIKFVTMPRADMAIHGDFERCATLALSPRH